MSTYTISDNKPPVCVCIGLVAAQRNDGPCSVNKCKRLRLTNRPRSARCGTIRHLVFPREPNAGGIDDVPDIGFQDAKAHRHQGWRKCDGPHNGRKNGIISSNLIPNFARTTISSHVFTHFDENIGLTPSVHFALLSCPLARAFHYSRSRNLQVVVVSRFRREIIIKKVAVFCCCCARAQSAA